MDWSALYGLLTALTLSVALLSRVEPNVRAGMVFALSWAFSNIVVERLGFMHGVVPLVAVHTICGVLIAALAIVYLSLPLILVLALYLLTLAWDTAAHITSTQGTYLYYATLNALFALKLLVVGGHSAWVGVRGWLDPFGERAGRSDSRSTSRVVAVAETVFGGLSYALIRPAAAVRFWAFGCPAVLRSARGGPARLLRRAVYRGCTASSGAERCFSYTHGRVANRACAAYCPHLRTRIGGVAPTGGHKRGHSAGAIPPAAVGTS